MKIHNLKSHIQEIHIISWLIKDIFWCFKLVWLATIMVIPTSLIAFYILFFDKKNRQVNLIMTSWLFMNIFWMLHELQNLNFLPVVLFMISGIFFTFVLLFNRFKNDVRNIKK